MKIDKSKQETEVTYDQDKQLDERSEEYQMFQLCHDKIKQILKLQTLDRESLNLNELQIIFDAKIVNTQFTDELFYQQAIINSGIISPKAVIVDIQRKHQNTMENIENIFKTLQCHFIYLFCIQSQFKCYIDYYIKQVQDLEIKNITFNSQEKQYVYSVPQQQQQNNQTLAQSNSKERMQKMFNIMLYNTQNDKLSIKLHVAKSKDSCFQVIFDGHVIRHKIRNNDIQNIPCPILLALYLNKIIDKILRDKSLLRFYEQINQKSYSHETDHLYNILFNFLSNLYQEGKIELFINWVFDLLDQLMENKNIIVIRMILQMLHKLDTQYGNHKITKVLTQFQTYNISGQLPENSILREIHLPQCQLHNQLTLKPEQRYVLQRVYKFLNIADDKEYTTNNHYNTLSNSPVLYLRDHDEETLDIYVRRQLQHDGLVFYDYDLLVVYYQQLVEQYEKKQITLQYFLKKHSIACQLIINYQRIEYRDENDYQNITQFMQQQPQ